MPHFTIFEGEAAVRMKNVRLEQENKRLAAENQRLRAKCGEAAVAEVEMEAQIAAERLGPQPIQSQGMEGQKVTIGRLGGGGPVQLNPLIARARPGLAQKQAQAVQAQSFQPDDLPASTQQVGQASQEDVASTRFSLLEPK